jgi:hypothetical protein
MSISIVVSNTVGINVKGTINNEDGQAKPFDFTLICRRMEVDEVGEALKADGSVTDFIVGVTKDWKGVKEPDGAPVVYAEDALRRLFKIPGVARVAFNAYLAECGAKEKN